MSWRSRKSSTPWSISIDTRRCGPDCQRRLSEVGRPPSPRTLTAKPSRTWGLRALGALGPRPGLVADLVGRVGAFGELTDVRVVLRGDRLVDRALGVRSEERRAGKEC